MNGIIFAINAIYQLFTLVLFAHIIMSWILPPFHQARVFVDRLIDPILAPIRNILPTAGGLDFSPIVLFFGADLIRRFLINILVSIG